MEDVIRSPQQDVAARTVVSARPSTTQREPSGTGAAAPIPARESVDAVVIGGGQAGLAVGYHLARCGVRFIVLDAHARVGDAWRERWDSLRLFTPAKLDGLDGMPFPASPHIFPSKDEMADYLAAYARRFNLPVRNGVRVERLFRRGERFVVSGRGFEVDAGQVVVAMAGYQRPSIPAFANTLAPEIVQMHSANYRNPAQWMPGGVLVVGTGNSGAELAMEAARHGHRTWMAGNDIGSIPFRPDSLLGRHVLAPMMLRLAFHRVLTVDTPIGRKLRPQMLARATPLIRVKASDLAAAGVERVPRMVGVRAGRPQLADGQVVDATNVVWCTGYDSGFDWIDLPVFGDDGQPIHRAGVVDRAPGLYFVGLNFLYAMSSSMIHGVSRDAARIARAVAATLVGESRVASRAPMAPTAPSP